MDERQLSEKLKSGDVSAFEQAYHLYIKYLTAICSRYVTDDDSVKDILQDSLVKIFSSARKFIYKGPGSLKAWMGRIVVNESLKCLRDKGKVEFSALDDSLQEPTEEQMSIIPNEVLFRLIRELPDGYRTVFNMFVIDKMSYKEIARLLKIKEGTVASQVYKAKAMLARKIKSYEG